MQRKTVHMNLLSVVLLAGFLFPGCPFSSDDNSEAAVWMSIAPIQCGNNAWDRAGKTLERYLADRGVDVLDRHTSIFADAVCEACSCITGQRVDILVGERDVEIMLAEGFVRDEDWPY